MQVGVIAVAGVHGADALVGGVVDDVFALPEADLEDAPLPPRQHGLAVVLLDFEAGRLLASGQRVKPHEAAVLFGDHRPGRAVALVGRQQQVAGRGAGQGPRGDRDGRRRQRRRRGVVLHGMRIARIDRELRLADRRLVGDREAGARSGGRTARAHLRGDRHPLAGDERVRRQEAFAGPRRVRAQDARVHAAARADHVHVGHVRRTGSEEADLGARGGVGRAGLGRDGDRVGHRGARGGVLQQRGADRGARTACAQTDGQRQRDEHHGRAGLHWAVAENSGEDPITLPLASSAWTS